MKINRIVAPTNHPQPWKRNVNVNVVIHRDIEYRWFSRGSSELRQRALLVIKG
jgi:hypothetical protein